MFQLLYFKDVIRDDQRAFLTKDGVFQRLLEPGRVRLFDPMHRLLVRQNPKRERRVALEQQAMQELCARLRIPLAGSA